MESVAGDWIVDPIAFEVFGWPIRWYALAYLAGFILGWRYALRLARTGLAKPTAEDMDEFLTWAVLGTILGGRIGYVLFYQPAYFLVTMPSTWGASSGCQGASTITALALWTW